MGDFFNIILLATFTGFLVSHPEALALLPSLAAMRGAVVTSMASRVSTGLHLGVIEASTARVLRREMPTLIALALTTSVYAALIISATSGYPAGVEVSIAAISGFLSILFLAPLSAYIATLGFRLNLDPDRYMAPVLTVIGDISTSPTIVAVVLLLNHARLDETLLALILVYLSLTLLFILLRGFPGRKKLLLESLAALGVVGLLEAYAGNLLVGYAQILLAVGVIHAVPSIMEDVGAAVSVIASKLSTLTHLYGIQDTVRMTPAILLEVLLGSITPLLVLSGITIATSSIAGITSSPWRVVYVILVGGILGILVFSTIALALVYLSIWGSVDPDNVVIPLLTSTVDAFTIPLLVAVSTLIV